jgi:hypothetical protein
MTHLKLFIFILVLLDISLASVTSISDEQKPNLLASYTMKRAKELGITRSELITSLETLKNKNEARSSRKLFKNDEQEYELQKRRDEAAKTMTDEVQSSLDQMVLGEETQEDEGEDESELDKISDLYLRTRDYIDTVKNELKDTIDNLQHDLDVQLIEHQNAVQNQDN